jgi:hypothetical protein
LVAITNIEICFHSIALLLRSDLHVQVNQWLLSFFLRYFGVIDQYNASNRQHHVTYDDNDKRYDFSKYLILISFCHPISFVWLVFHSYSTNKCFCDELFVFDSWYDLRTKSFRLVPRVVASSPAVWPTFLFLINIIS